MTKCGELTFDITMPSHNAEQKKIIRKQCRELRNKLTQAEQTAAAVSVVEHFYRLVHENKPKSIGVFLANDGELSPHKLVEYCWLNDISTYLPVIDTDNRGYLRFYEYSQNTPLKNNAFGIPEPDIQFARNIQHLSLDWVLMPLVAFTSEGQRLGMGGGFYDRTFAMIKNEQNDTIRLIGLAHECQCIPSLPVESWDIDMHAMLTPERYIQL